MVNLQSLLRLVAVFSSPLVGFIIGREHGGWMLGVVFALIALPVGLALVETPYWVAGYLDRRRLKAASSEALKADLDADYRHYGHLNILRELRLRGESIEFELPRLIGFLASSSVVNRAVGCAGIKEFFPAIGERLSDYNPFPEEAQFDSVVRNLVQEFPSKERSHSKNEEL